MHDDSDHDDGFAGDLFGEEIEPVPPPKPTTEVYQRQDPNAQPHELHIRLVGSHPLWAHHLWNASKVLASLLDSQPECWIRDRAVLELGAGGGLPSLMAALHGAKVVATDYPDPDLIENLEHNMKNNLAPDLRDRVVVQGYVWGTSTTSLRAQVPDGKYDTIILSDLVFNHSQHHALLKTCRELVRPKTGQVLVFYTHHRPHLAHRDLAFFDIAQRPFNPNADPDDRDAFGYGFSADHFVQEKMHVMFEEDPGDVHVRSTVHGWKLWLP